MHNLVKLPSTVSACKDNHAGTPVSLFTDKLLLGSDKVPAMTFYNFCHVTIISGYENITLQGYHVIQCCHLGRMVLEKTEL